MAAGRPIEIRGIAGVRALLASVSPAMAAAADRAETRMAYQIMQAEREQMRQDIDRPTPFSISSVRYKPAGSAGQFGAPPVAGAAVYMQDAFTRGSRVGPDEWLGVQIVGGQTAGPRRSEKRLQMMGLMPRGKVIVPDKSLRLDRYGNIPGALMTRILSNLGAIDTARTTRGNAETKYIVTGPRGNEDGIWGRVGSTWRPLIWFVDRQTYDPRYRWYQRAETEVIAGYTQILDAETRRAIRDL
jgi:hypothetical protein